MAYKTNIVIIGGGPVGVALALELSLYDVNSIIIERHNMPLQLPRGQSLSPRTMEIFSRWGAGQEIIESRMLAKDVQSKTLWVSALNGTLFTQINVGSDKDTTEFSEFSYQRLPLWQTEKVLRKHLAKSSQSELMKGWTANKITQNDNKVTVTARRSFETDNPETVEITADYAVACDGANSFIRDQLGIELCGEDVVHETRQVVFRAPGLINVINHPKGLLYYIFQEHAYAAMGPVDDAGLWYAQIPVYDETVRDDSKVSELLYQFAGFEFKHEINYTTLWKMRAQIANQFRCGRVFLAGDSAHVLPPTGGHGLNTGIPDIINLAWKLAASLQSWGQCDLNNLLDSYHEERYQVAKFAMEASLDNAKNYSQILKKYSPITQKTEFATAISESGKQHTQGIGIDLGYHYAFSSLIPDGDKNCPLANMSYEPKFEPGHHLPHILLEDGQSLYHQLKPCFNLISAKINIIDEQSLPVHVICKPELAARIGQDAIIVRPDGHIAWRGSHDFPDLHQFLGYDTYAQDRRD